MTNTWLAPLEQIQVILFDYSALFELGHSSEFKSLTDIVLARRIQIVLSGSFNFYHTCVYRAQNKNENFLLQKIEEFLDMLSQEKLLIANPSVFPIFSLLPLYANRKDVCLFTSCNSSVLNMIREANLNIDFSLGLFCKEEFAYYPDLSAFLNSKEAYDVNSVAASSDYLDVAIYVNIGDKVFVDNGESILLSEKISTGSEGLVFRTQDPRMVAKIYHRGVMTALRWMKLTRMTKMGLLAKGICWPTSLLYNQNHEPVGYLMPIAEGCTLGSVFDGQDAITERFPEWDRNSVVQAACQVFEKIIYLHLHGILIGDIQLKNIMIKSASEVYLIDMDSIQLEDLPCPVGTEEFTPPELWDRSFSTFLRTSLHEDYSCGILAFSLLFCGQHPYNQRLGKETLREEIAALAFPYKCGESDNSGIPLGGYDKIWQVIPSNLQKMFYGAFSEGKRFQTVEWYAALDSYKDQLSSSFFPDPQAYALFPYTKRVEVRPTETNNGIKRSIRDSIIHVPDSSDKTTNTSDRVMYNGRSIGSAFVNQERLTELELNKYQKTASSNKPVFSSDKMVQNETTTTLHAAQQLRPINQESAKKRSTDKHSSQKNTNYTTFLILLLIALAILGALIFFTYYSKI